MVQQVVRYFTPPVVGALVAIFLTILPKPVEDLLALGEQWLSPTIRAALPKEMNTGVAAMIGFFLGFSVMHFWIWLRWQLLRILFSYRGWMFDPKATSTKIWAVLVKFLMQSHRGPYGTFTLQNLLPRLPVPSIEQTCHKYLQSVKPLLTDVEYANTKQVVERFKHNEAPVLHNYLKKRSLEKTNWLADWWFDLAYLTQRTPIAINSNYYCLCSEYLPTNNPVARAANIVYYGVQFHDLIQSNKLPVYLANDLVPVCMDGYRYMFNTCRIPGLEKDTLKRYEPASHVVVIRKGMYFKVEVYAPDNSGQITQLTPYELQQQFQKIWDITEALEDDFETAVAAFTAINRTEWAKQRQALLKASPVNVVTLEEIENAMFHLSFEACVPKDASDQAKMMLAGEGMNRWFDKSFATVIFPNSRGGGFAEHGTADATLYSRLWEFAQFRERYSKDGDVAKLECDTKRPLKPPKKLEWQLDGFEDHLHNALKEHRANYDDIDMIVYPSEYGKGWIKSKRMSPDGFLQMCLQLAFYRLHKYTPKTYESASTRMFAQGRTETIRPISEQSVAWVKAMDNPDVSREQKISMLKKAIHCQTQYKLDATNGEGCDRHLLGMYCASRELNLPVPALFMDKAWQLPDKLSTSQTPPKITNNWTLETCSRGGGFGTVDYQGYGVSYVFIGEDLVNLHISSRNHCETTNSTKFGQTVVQVMSDIREMLS